MAWYEQFFGEDYMRFHVLGGEGHEKRAPAECDFVVSTLELEPGSRVLDLCCGQGRHAVELARRGFQVTGLDLSEYLLGLARQKAEQAGIEVELVRGDMRDLPWRSEFDAVINMFTSFGYLESEEEDERVLRAVHEALRPGGRMLLDLPSWDRMATRHTPRNWYEHEECLVLDDDEWDPVTGHWSRRRCIIAHSGARREHHFTLRIYTHPEVAAMLRRAGLAWEKTYGDLDGAEYGPGSRRMLLVARKPQEESG